MKDQGRTVQHFGKWYLWSVTPGGALTLVSVDRMTETMRTLSKQVRAEWDLRA